MVCSKSDAEKTWKTHTGENRAEAPEGLHSAVVS